MTTPRIALVRCIADAAGAARLAAIAGPDALTPADVLEQRPDLCLTASRAGKPIARASVWWSRVPPLPGERPGLLGHYAADDDDAAHCVLEGARTALRDAGASRVLGPIDGDTWHRYRLVTWRSPEPPFFLEPDQPDAYRAQFEAAGFTPFAHYYSSACEDLAAVAPDPALADRLRNEGLSLRPFDPGRRDRDLAALWRLACDAFAPNLLFTSIPLPTFQALYAPLLDRMPARFVTFAEQDGEGVGFLLSYPDVLRAMHRVPEDTIVMKTIGVATAHKRRGVGRVLFDHGVAVAREAGFRRSIHALIHEGNPSGRFGGEQPHVIRRYALYARTP